MNRRPCLACESQVPRATFVVREMMYGLGEEFEYWECEECGAIQISEMPVDVSRYYRSAEYYAFRGRGRLVSYLKGHQARYAFTGRGILGRVLTTWYGCPPIITLLKDWIAVAGLTETQHILDVGCGAAPYFHDLMAVGYRNIAGVDPFIESDIDFGDGVTVKKLSLADIRREFDFVMLHHSFEHMPDPRSVMRHLFRVVRPGKIVLIRTPVAGCHAWRTYGTNWVQLDAPRHLFIPSVESLSRLARDAGFTLERVLFDSSDFQFWGSEQNAKGVPLCDAAGHINKPRPPLFPRSQLREFRERARRLNEIGEGDQAGFYLRRPASSAGSSGGRADHAPVDRRENG